MNRNKYSGIKFGFVLCATLICAPLGCETYHEPPHAHGVYAPPPQPHVVEHTYVEVHVVSDFYEPLTPYGEWVVVESYGRCWRPVRVDPHWRPYCSGHWVLTDVGWYWESVEPWGWATYHYGRWDWSVEFGWIWVPETQWAPAWVSWRHGEGYVGWAPLPPAARFSRGVFVDVDIHIEPRAFVFVEERRFLQPIRPTTVIVNNTTIVNKTVNITNIKVENNVVINKGPKIDVIEKVSGQKVKPVSFQELRKQEVEVFKKSKGKAPSPAHKEVGPYKKEGPSAPAPHQVEQRGGPAYEPKAPGSKKEVYEGHKAGPVQAEPYKKGPPTYKAPHAEPQAGPAYGPKAPGPKKEVHEAPKAGPVQAEPYKKGPPTYKAPHAEPQVGPAYGLKAPSPKKDVYEAPKAGPVQEPYKKGPPTYKAPHAEPQAGPAYGLKAPSPKKEVYEAPKAGPVQKPYKKGPPAPYAEPHGGATHEPKVQGPKKVNAPDMQKSPVLYTPPEGQKQAPKGKQYEMQGGQGGPVSYPGPAKSKPKAQGQQAIQMPTEPQGGKQKGTKGSQKGQLNSEQQVVEDPSSSGSGEQNAGKKGSKKKAQDQ